jgi:hypothetical protein
MTDSDRYDTPWKDILNAYFQEFMTFFFPEIAKDIDWSKGYESLDKELRKLAKDAQIGHRIADKLMKVWKKNGEEAWVLIHVEVQSQEETGFGHRVYVYHYRIYDLHKLPVASLAVLADDNPNWFVDRYEQDLWGCRTTFRFLSAKILEYRKNWDFLESSENPFAVAVMAHLHAMETRKNPANRFKFKLSLSKSLYRRGWTKQQIIDLYRFIDWVMALPENLENAYHEELVKIEEVYKMPYVTTAERIGMRKGVEKGRKNTARNLLSLGILTEEQIAQATELSVDEIRRLKGEAESASAGGGEVR